MTRLSGRIRFTEGLPPEQQAQVVAETIPAHDEPWLLAYTFNQLTEHGISKMAQERDKYIVLAALVLVDVIAVAGVGGS